MKFTRFVRKVAFVCAISGTVVAPASATFADGLPAPLATTQTMKIADVALAEGGVLRGQVLSRAGAAQPGVAVSVRQDGKEVVRARTDAQGRFQAEGLPGGMYVVATDGAAGAVRAWSHQTAPPAAAPGILLIPGQELARGQNGGLAGQLVGNPGVWIVGGVIGTVLAVSLDDPNGS